MLIEVIGLYFLDKGSPVDGCHNIEMSSRCTITDMLINSMHGELIKSHLCCLKLVCFTVRSEEQEFEEHIQMPVDCCKRVGKSWSV